MTYSLRADTSSPWTERFSQVLLVTNLILRNTERVFCVPRIVSTTVFDSFLNKQKEHYDYIFEHVQETINIHYTYFSHGKEESGFSALKSDLFRYFNVEPYDSEAFAKTIK